MPWAPPWGRFCKTCIPPALTCVGSFDVHGIASASEGTETGRSRNRSSSPPDKSKTYTHTHTYWRRRGLLLTSKLILFCKQDVIGFKAILNMIHTSFILRYTVSTRGWTHLHPLLSTDSNPDVRSLNHSHVVRTISDGKGSRLRPCLANQSNNLIKGFHIKEGSIQGRCGGRGGVDAVEHLI